MLYERDHMSHSTFSVLPSLTWYFPLIIGRYAMAMLLSSPASAGPYLQDHHNMVFASFEGQLWDESGLPNIFAFGQNQELAPSPEPARNLAFVVFPFTSISVGQPWLLAPNHANVKSSGN